MEIGPLQLAVGDPAKGLGGPAPRPPPPLFLEQTEAWRAEKKFLETELPPYISVWMTGPPVLSEGLNPPLTSPLRGESKGRIGKKTKKELLSFKMVISLLFALSQCSHVWRFCATWRAHGFSRNQHFYVWFYFIFWWKCAKTSKQVTYLWQINN